MVTPKPSKKKNLAGKIWIWSTRWWVSSGQVPLHHRQYNSKKRSRKEKKRAEKRQSYQDHQPLPLTHTCTHMSCSDGKEGLVQICCRAVLHNHNSVTRGASGGAETQTRKENSQSVTAIKSWTFPLLKVRPLWQQTVRKVRRRGAGVAVAWKKPRHGDTNSNNHVTTQTLKLRETDPVDALL